MADEITDTSTETTPTGGGGEVVGSAQAPTDDTTGMILELMERMEAFETRLTETYEFFKGLEEAKGETVAEERMLALFQLRLAAAGQKLGAELTDRVSEALERSRNAERAVEVAQNALTTAGSALSQITAVIETANEILEQAGVISSAVEEMRRIGAFVDQTKEKVEATAASLREEVDARIASLTAVPAPQPLTEPESPTEPKPKRPWE